MLKSFEERIPLRLIHALGRALERDPAVRGRLRVVFLPDYGVTLLKVAAEAPKGANILAMLPDTGERYLSTPLFADVPADMTPEELEISRSTPSAVTTTPVSCVLAPAASATGVRDALLVTGKPWNIPAATQAAPSGAAKMPSEAAS